MALAHTRQNTITFAPTAITVAASVVFANVSGHGSLIVVLEGTFDLGAAIFEGTIDDTHWFPVGAAPAAGGSFSSSTGAVVKTAAATAFALPIPAGITSIRLRVTTFNSGTMNVGAAVAGGSLSVPSSSSSGGGGDGAILDGADSSIKATVFDYTNSNPVAVVLRDSSGDYVSVGGGTQYAEDTPSTAAELVTMAGVVRVDTAASLVGADLDRTELQVNATGNLRTIDERFIFTGTQLKVVAVQEEGAVFNLGGYTYDSAPPSVQMVPVLPALATAADPSFSEGVLDPLSIDLSGRLRIVASALPLPSGAATGAKQDTGNTSLSSIDGKTPVLGQQLAAASSPVVLTAAQVSTLTPPAAITGFALETGGNLASIKAKTDNIPAQGQALAAASLPVVLTALQQTALTPPAAITGFATSANQTTELASLATIAALSKAEDAVSADGDPGIGALGVRQDVPFTDTSASGDYAFSKTDAQGRLWINSDVLGAKFDRMTALLELVATEMKVQNEVLATGLNVRDPLDGFRNDPSFAGVATLN